LPDGRIDYQKTKSGQKISFGCKQFKAENHKFAQK
jgi:hypothetical protein